MVRKLGQIMVRIYVGRDPEAGRRKYVGKFIHWGAAVRTGPAQPHARAAGSRSQHPLFPTNRRSVSRRPYICGISITILHNTLHFFYRRAHLLRTSWGRSFNGRRSLDALGISCTIH